MTLIIEVEKGNFSDISDNLERLGYQRQEDGSLWGKDLYVRFADPKIQQISIDDFSKIYTPTSPTYSGLNARAELVDVVREVIKHSTIRCVSDEYNKKVDIKTFY